MGLYLSPITTCIHRLRHEVGTVCKLFTNVFFCKQTTKLIFRYVNWYSVQCLEALGITLLWWLRYIENIHIPGHAVIQQSNPQYNLAMITWLLVKTIPSVLGPTVLLPPTFSDIPGAAAYCSVAESKHIHTA